MYVVTTEDKIFGKSYLAGIVNGIETFTSDIQYARKIKLLLTVQRKISNLQTKYQDSSSYSYEIA